MGRDDIAVVLIALAPVVIIPGAENRFVFGKLAFSAAGATVGATVAARGRLPRPAQLLLAVGGAILVLAIVNSGEPLQGLIGRAPRYEGAPVLGIYLACGWIGARIFGPDPAPRTRRTLVATLAFTGVAVALLAVLETFGLRPLSSDVSRPGSLLGQASDEGALGVLLFGALLYPALASRGRDWVAAAGAAGGGVCVALSASRAALLGLLVAVIVVAVAEFDLRRLAALAGVVAVVAAVVFIAPESRGRVTGTSPLATATAQGRTLLWEETAALVGHHPILGVGPDNYLDAITVEHNFAWQKDVGPANPPDSPHDWVLQAASDGGIPLAIAAVGLAGLTGWAGLRRLRERDGAPSPLAVGLFAGLAGYGVALAFGFTTPGTTPLAAFFGGAVLAVPAGREALPRAVSIVAVLVGTALTVVSVLASAAEIQVREALDSAASGNLTAAEHDFDGAHSLRPWDVSVAQTASFAYVQIAALGGQTQPQALAYAVPWLRQVQSALPHDEEQVVDEASADEMARDYTAAETRFQSALARDPFNPQILLRLGVVQGEAAQYQAAINTFLEVANVAPRSPDPWTDLAIVYGDLHDSADQAQARATAARLGG